MISPVFASTKAVRSVMNDVLKSFRTYSGHSYTEKTSSYESRRSVCMFIPHGQELSISTEVQKRFDVLGFTNTVKAAGGYLRCNTFLL